MERALAAGCFALALALPASAEAPAITPETDRVMWCASAFFWLAGNAADAGDNQEADLYDGWATKLTESGTTLLNTAGFDLARIQEIIGEYDQLVLDELASESPRYDVAVCPELVAE
jgi:hypothetical protein